MAAGSLRDPDEVGAFAGEGDVARARLPGEARDDLRAVARLALEYGVHHGCPPRIDLVALAAPLHAPRASFVTLERRGALRGCIGTLEAEDPLAVSVARNAVKAAKDPRLEPVHAAELPEIAVKISVLSPLVPLAARNEADLLAALRAGVDGLVLRDGPHSATFLPSVWATLPSPESFVRELRRKACLAPDHWSEGLRFWRYEVEEIV